mmetsp:Transcript_17502/g.43202  ORF Transcript_17502/g.43202 Transcript_17502/m.43202 type:complete len:289 (-) Transcript_17502:93-959(-)
MSPVLPALAAGHHHHGLELPALLALEQVPPHAVLLPRLEPAAVGEVRKADVRAHVVGSVLAARGAGAVAAVERDGRVLHHAQALLDGDGEEDRRGDDEHGRHGDAAPGGEVQEQGSVGHVRGVCGGQRGGEVLRGGEGGDGQRAALHARERARPRLALRGAPPPHLLRPPPPLRADLQLFVQLQRAPLQSLVLLLLREHLGQTDLGLRLERLLLRARHSRERTAAGGGGGGGGRGGLVAHRSLHHEREWAIPAVAAATMGLSPPQPSLLLLRWVRRGGAGGGASIPSP